MRLQKSLFGGIFFVAVAAGFLAGGVAAEQLSEAVTPDFLDFQALKRVMTYDPRKQPNSVPIRDVPEPVIHAFVAATDRDFYRRRRASISKREYELAFKILICADRDGNNSSATNDRFSMIMRCVTNNLASYHGTSTRYFRHRGIYSIIAAGLTAGNDRTILRKFKEVVFTSRLEKECPKDKALEYYLNHMYFGLGAHGVRMAALKYFNKDLNSLAIEEIAYLAALPKWPANLHPTRNTDRAVESRNWVLTRMAEDGYISQHQAEEARAKPLGFSPPTAAKR